MLTFGNIPDRSYFTQSVEVVIFSRDFNFSSSIYNGQIERSEKSQDANFESRTAADVSVIRIGRAERPDPFDGCRYDCGSTVRTRL